MFDLIKYKMYAFFALIGVAFAGYLKWLQVSNRSKSKKIDQLNREAAVAKEVSKMETDKASFNGAQNIQDAQIKRYEEITTKADKERGDVKDIDTGRINTILI